MWKARNGKRLAALIPFLAFFFHFWLVAELGKKAIMWGRRRKRERKKKEEREEEGEVCGILDALEVSVQLSRGDG